MNKLSFALNKVITNIKFFGLCDSEIHQIVFELDNKEHLSFSLNQPINGYMYLELISSDKADMKGYNQWVEKQLHEVNGFRNYPELNQLLNTKIKQIMAFSENKNKISGNYIIEKIRILNNEKQNFYLNLYNGIEECGIEIKLNENKQSQLKNKFNLTSNSLFQNLKNFFSNKKLII